jgi:glycosyltransferase involved in cell wall biosynthesis
MGKGAWENLMSKFTIVTSVYNEYELLRQFVESILHNVDSNSYEKVIIVNDFSRKDTKLEEYCNYLNTLEKFQVIMFPEYRHMLFYNQLNQDVDTFDKTLFSNEKPNLGVMKSYQMALEYVQTPYVLICDTDIVFLKKFQSTLNEISKLYDKNQDVMTISQLVGHSSDDIFKSNKIGLKNMPGENGGAGGPSPMFSTFRVAAWTEHNICPLCSTPGKRRGNGFIDFFLSVVGNKYQLMNFPFFSQEFVFHIGGGTARRNLHNKPGVSQKVRFGNVTDTAHNYGSRRANKIYDYYAGAHLLKMTDEDFTNYLKEKYNTPFEVLSKPFSESLIQKYELVKCDWMPAHPEVLARMELVISDEIPDRNHWWKRYRYGEKSDMKWGEE